MTRVILARREVGEVQHLLGLCQNWHSTKHRQLQDLVLGLKLTPGKPGFWGSELSHRGHFSAVWFPVKLLAGMLLLEIPSCIHLHSGKIPLSHFLMIIDSKSIYLRETEMLSAKRHTATLFVMVHVGSKLSAERMWKWWVAKWCLH